MVYWPSSLKNNISLRSTRMKPLQRWATWMGTGTIEFCFLATVQHIPTVLGVVARTDHLKKIQSISSCAERDWPRETSLWGGKGGILALALKECLKFCQTLTQYPLP